ncbi:hypothetical protein HAZT_HAZT005650, partial [Hyalella azteca]
MIVAWVHTSAHGKAVLTVGTHVLTNNPRVSVHVERNSWTLILEAVTSADRGRYMCQVSTVPPTNMYAYVQVVGMNVVTVPPVPPLIPSPLGDVSVEEGANATLTCEATGDPPPALTWRREDGLPFALAGTKVLEYKGSQLALVSVQRETAGAFLCVATNGVPPAVSSRALLYVKCESVVTVSVNMPGLRRALYRDVEGLSDERSTSLRSNVLMW